MGTTETRTSFFNMTVQQRDAFLTREDVAGFFNPFTGDEGTDLSGQRRGAWHPHGDAGPAEGEYWLLLQADQPGTLPSAEGQGAAEYRRDGSGCGMVPRRWPASTSWS